MTLLFPDVLFHDIPGFAFDLHLVPAARGADHRHLRAHPVGADGLVFGSGAFAHDHVLEDLVRMVRLEVDAALRRRAGGVAEHAVLDEEVLDREHRDALPVVAVADAFPDRDVLPREPLL